MQQIAEQKLKAFSIGTMGKRQMSKKEMEEQRKKEQEEAAAQVRFENETKWNEMMKFVLVTVFSNLSCLTLFVKGEEVHLWVGASTRQKFI